MRWMMAPVRGWLRTSERLAAGDDDAPAHALAAMVRTYERFMCGDMERSRAEAGRAIELGERLGVQPAVVIGRVATARVTILDGDVDEGLDQLDEVGALLMSGQVDPLTTGMMLCELICAAQGLAMHDRAAEWTEVMERWRHGAAFGGIHGRCRVHRAEMLRMSGPTDAAEAEALGACDELRPWMRREFGWPLAELGNIRLRLIRDLKGFRYLERLLADPDREFHVLDLVSVDGGTLPTRPMVDPADEMTPVRGDADLPTIDDEAREAYRRRLREVEEDLEDAKAANDLGRMELAERDRDFLVAELSHAVGLGGRLRSTGGDVEKARGSVSRCLRYALGQLADHLPSLADHLRASLQTGTYCAYRPDPMAAVTWQT